MSEPSSSAQAGEPRGWVGPGGIRIRFDLQRINDEATKELAQGIIYRTIRQAQQVTELIRRGAKANAMPGLEVLRSTGNHPWLYPLLSLAIDNLTDDSMPSIWARDSHIDWHHPVALPRWPSREVEAQIMNALIDAGADMSEVILKETRPIRVAISGGNRAAFDLLLDRGVQLRGVMAMVLPRDNQHARPSAEYEQLLLYFYRRLVERDRSLATEADEIECNLVHEASLAPPSLSKDFIDTYLDLLRANGANLTAGNHEGSTPLHMAAHSGFHHGVDYLCCNIGTEFMDAVGSNDDIRNYGMTTDTPLERAAAELDICLKALHRGDGDEHHREVLRTETIPNLKTSIRILLKAGADISRLRTHNERDRRIRQLVLSESCG
ncbi:unnamed protein product [Vitrella brassicaformis CCMP3155]|uniref:Uncharacterized protein n=1 Tax=Vitrella brassicaformis (strain CCMP3155) TaxID=1169540 RepID=A0A0G4G3N4_VITBC|nr:unnamed protein product [Vitrella brassicaformis CCMP3155]|mmetsp:Transcript_4878/g.13211  ORF Transcript_4878/g.13211 Transcript_4878/m.13211 type:complete len:380 (+) Transcript_4878:200-1339(+)|eukprot:CEM22670.1 unnamed protein product [Vitrella brassicaformis CCMP3155]